MATTFRIVVETAVAKAKQNLSGLQRRLELLEQKAKGAGTPLGRSYTRGARQAKDSLRGLRDVINNIISIGTGFVLVNKLFELSDAATIATNRLKTVTNGTKELTAVQEELFKIADQTRSQFQATAQIYQRTRRATVQLGLSQRDTLDFVKSLNQAVVVSGVGSREAAQGLIQFAQGLASNRLSGEELRSVLEQLTFVSDIIADEFNRNADLVAKFGKQTSGSLRDVAEKGALDAQLLVDAFRNSEGEIAEAFSKLGPTIDQAFTIVSNNVLKLVQDFQSSTGVVTVFARAIIALAKNLEAIIKVASVLAFTIGTKLAQQAIPKAIAATKAWVLSLGKIGVVSTAITAVAGAVLVFSDKIKIAKNSSATLFDFLQAFGTEMIVVFQTMGRVILNAFNGLGKLFGPITASAGEFFKAFELGKVTFFSVIRAIASGIDAVNTAINTVVEGIITVAAKAAKSVIKALEQIINKTSTAINSVSSITGITVKPKVDFTAAIVGIDALKTTMLNAIPDEETGATDIVNRVIERTKEIAEARKKVEGLKADLSAISENLLKPSGEDAGKAAEQTNKFAEALGKIQQEIQILSADPSQRDRLEELFQITNQVGGLNSNQKQQLNYLLDIRDELQKRADVLDEIRGPQREFREDQKTLNTLLKNGEITLFEYNNQLDALSESTKGVRTFRAITKELNQELLTQERTLGKVGSALVAQQAVLKAQNEAKGNLTEDEKEYIRTQAKSMEVTKQAKSIVKDIKGPLQDYNDQVAALRRAQDELNLSSEEYALQLQRIQDAASGINLQSLKDQVKDQQNLLGSFGVEGKVQQAVRDAERRSQRTNVPVDLKEVEQLTRRREELRLQRSALKSTIGVQTEFNDKVRTLNNLFKSGQIDSLQFSQQYKDAFTTLRDNSTDLATELGTSFEQAFQQAGNAIVNFAAKGELNIRQLAATMITSLLRVFAQKTITQGLGLLGQAFGGGGGFAGRFINAFSGGSFGAGGALAQIGGSLPAFADGGSFNVGGNGGTDSQLVQFKATPGEQVTVQTPQQVNNQQPAPSPEPKVNIVNVTDVEETARFMSSNRGEKLIMNVINNNSNQVQKLLNRG